MANALVLNILSQGIERFMEQREKRSIEDLCVSCTHHFLCSQLAFMFSDIIVLHAQLPALQNVCEGDIYYNDDADKRDS